MLNDRKINFMFGFLAVAYLTSCTTTSGSQNSNDISNDIFDTTTEKVVIQKVGEKDPVVSPHDRNHWLKLRSTNDLSIKKIYGLIATNESLAAERAARKFLEKNPGSVEGLTALATALAISGQYDLAAYYSKLLTKKLPDNPHSFNIKGLAVLNSATRMEDYRKAESYFQRAFESSKAEIAAGLNLGQLYLELGNSNTALEIFASTSERCHSCIPAQMGYGIAAKRMGKSSEALAAFKNVIKDDKEFAPAWYHMALVYKNSLSDQKKAEESLKQVLSMQTADNSIKDLAHTLLRSIKAENEKQLIAGEDTAGNLDNEPLKIEDEVQVQNQQASEDKQQQVNLDDEKTINDQGDDFEKYEQAVSDKDVNVEPADNSITAEDSFAQQSSVSTVDSSNFDFKAVEDLNGESPSKNGSQLDQEDVYSTEFSNDDDF
ncbi:MAG: tetratricopeptide repeat protein [Bdellovibrionota bacterium]